MFLLGGIYHMGGNGLDIVKRTVLSARQVAVAHQRHLVSRYLFDTMEHISALFYPCQYDHASMQLRGSGSGENDTLPATYDEGQHAVAIHGQGDTEALG